MVVRFIIYTKVHGNLWWPLPQNRDLAIQSQFLRLMLSILGPITSIVGSIFHMKAVAMVIEGVHYKK